MWMTKQLVAVLAGAAALLACDIAAAQNWPTRALTLVVPFAAGGTTDLVARPLAQSLSERLGQTVIVDNRAGAGGTLGSGAAAKSPADGNTLFLATIAQTVAPGLYRNLSYDLVRDFDPITVVGEVPNVLIVNPSVPAKTAAELIAYIKRQSRQGEFRLGRPRQRRAPVRGAFSLARRGRYRARPLQGRRADDDGPDRRPYPDGDRNQRLGLAAHQGRRGSRASGQHPRAVAVLPRACRRSRRPACAAMT